MYAKLTDEEIGKIRKLESEIGVYLLAEQRLKDLSEEELKVLKGTEKSIGAVLIAYES